MYRTPTGPPTFPGIGVIDVIILAKNAEKSPPIREQSQMSQCCKPRCSAFRAKILGPWSDPGAETLYGNSLREVAGNWQELAVGGRKNRRFTCMDVYFSELTCPLF